MKIWCAVLILVVGVFIILVGGKSAAPSITKYTRLHKRLMVWETQQDLLSGAKNGDVLLFSGKGYGSHFVRLITNSQFSHVCMVFRDSGTADRTGEDIPYTWDSDLGQGCRAGPRVMRLADKLARHKGPKIVGWKRLTTGRPSTEKFLNVISRYLAYTFDREMFRWAHSRVFQTVGSCAPGKIFCSELIAKTSQDLGLFQKNVPACWYAPGDWMSGRLDLSLGVTYGPTVFTKFV